MPNPRDETERLFSEALGQTWTHREFEPKFTPDETKRIKEDKAKEEEKLNCWLCKAIDDPCYLHSSPME